jgi:hypothetical protein
MKMKVKMTLKEKHAKEYCEKFKKSWDFYCIASDSYLNGYRQAIIDCNSDYDRAPDYLTNFDLVGEDEVEVELKDGEHMIGQKSTG